MLEMKIGELKKFQKNMGKLSFILTPIKDKKGQYRLRVGKRYILIDCPSREIGESVKNALMAALRTTSEKVSQILEYIEHNAEQMELDLFPRLEDAIDGESTRSGDRP